MRINKREFSGFCRDRYTYCDYVGLLLGYSAESRNFFTTKVMKLSGCKEAYDKSNIVSYMDLKDTGFWGTGYVSYPKEVLDIKENRLTKKDIINGINERRSIVTKFPKLETFFGDNKSFNLDEIKMSNLINSNSIPLRDKSILKKILNHDWGTK
jgi:hypothetical protein